MDFFADVWTFFTWEKVLTSFIELPDGNLRDGHELT